MATKINKNLENSFVFAPNEMQQVAFEGAKQNECLKDGAKRLLFKGGSGAAV